MNPIVIAKSDAERCLIEPSVNSVRVSIKIKQQDEIEEILCHKFTRFLMQRSEAFIIMRRKAVEGYDISFLITHRDVENLYRHKLVDFMGHYGRPKVFISDGGANFISNIQISLLLYHTTR